MEAKKRAAERILSKNLGYKKKDEMYTVVGERKDLSQVLVGMDGPNWFAWCNVDRTCFVGISWPNWALPLEEHAKRSSC